MEGSASPDVGDASGAATFVRLLVFRLAGTVPPTATTAAVRPIATALTPRVCVRRVRSLGNGFVARCRRTSRGNAQISA